MLPHNNEDFQINISASAFSQIHLMLENDYTLKDLYFRLKIDGKGCEGFSYATGFSQKNNDDIVLEFTESLQWIHLIMDPFTAFYCKEGILDFYFNPKEEAEGFAFTNNNEHQYHGKFFKDEELVPKASEL